MRLSDTLPCRQTIDRRIAAAIIEIERLLRIRATLDELEQIDARSVGASGEADQEAKIEALWDILREMWSREDPKLAALRDILGGG